MRFAANRSTISAGIALAVSATLAAFWLTCALPASPAPGEDDIEIGVLPDSAGSGGLRIGDSLTLLLPLYPAHLIDSVYLSARDSCGGTHAILDSGLNLGDPYDTLRAAARLTCAGSVTFMLRVVTPGGREYLDSIRVVVAGTAGCSWRSAAVIATIAEGETLSVDLKDILRCGGGTNEQLSLISGGPATDNIDTAKVYRFAASFRDAGRDTARVVVYDGIAPDTMKILVTINDVNQAPVFRNDSFSMNVARGLAAVSPVALVAADSIDGDPLTYALPAGGSNLPPGVTASIDTARHVRVSAPANADTGAYHIVATVNDGHGGWDSLRIGITIYDPTAADRLPPTITADPGNPAKNAVVHDSTLELVFSIDDPSGIHHVVYVKAGHPADSIPVDRNDSAKYRFSWTLREGPDSLRLIAFDSSVHRNRAVYAYSVVYRMPPRIITQPPATISVVAPARLEVAVEARGAAPLSYQWYRGGTAVGTGASLVIDPSSIANSGVYYCEVSNSEGTERSTDVTVTVTNAPKEPRILQNPRDTRVTKGDAAVFSVTVNADASPAPTYRWYTVGSASAIDSSGATLTIPGVTYAHEGRQYFVVVSNSQGRDTSISATLSVEDVTRPVITIIGAADTTILLNSSYTDPGAAATDDRDGSITSRITKVSTVDLNKPGRYTVTYYVLDADSNKAVAKLRNVIVDGWVEVGSRFPINEYSMTLSPDGVPHIAYTDDNDSGAVKVVKLQGNEWVRVGELASGKDAILPVLRFSHRETPPVPYLAVDENRYRDSLGDKYGAVVRRNRGMAWEALRGYVKFESELYRRNEFVDMTISSDDSIFMIASGIVWKYDFAASNTWNMVGDTNHGLQFMAYGDCKSNMEYLPNGELYIAGTDNETGFTGVRRRVGSRWQNIGSVGERFRGPYLNLRGTRTNQLYIITGEGDSPNKPTLWKLNGTAWDSVFCPIEEFKAGDFSLAISADEKLIFACTVWDREDKLYIWTKRESVWVTVPAIGVIPIAQDEAFEPTVTEYQGTIYVTFKSQYPHRLVTMRYSAP